MKERKTDINLPKDFVPLPKSGPERDARIKRQKQFRKIASPMNTSDIKVDNETG